MKIKVLLMDEFAIMISEVRTGINVYNGYNDFIIQAKIPRYMFYESYTMRHHISESERYKSLLTCLVLIGKGMLNDSCSSFFFKPWILDEGENINRLMENVVFVIPEYMLFMIIEEELRKGRYTWQDIKNLDVIEDIRYEYLEYGINDLRGDVKKFISYDISLIKNIDNLVKLTLSDENEINIPHKYTHLFKKYFFD